MLCEAVALFALLAPPTSPDVQWQPVVDRIAPLMAGFHADRGTARQTWLRFSRVLAKAGLLARYDDRKHKQLPGFYLLTGEGTVPVQGAKEGTLVFLHHTDSTPRSEPEHSLLALFRREPGGIRGYALKDYGNQGTDAGESMRPVQAALADGNLVIVGLYAWMGNGAHVEALGFRTENDGRRPVRQETAGFESWGSTKLILSKDGHSILPIRIESRTYPKHLNACHATAQLAYEEQWVFPSGRPTVAWKRERDTPFNALDRLYYAIERNDKAVIRRSSLNAAIAKRIQKLHARALKGTPDIDFPGGLCDSDVKVIGIENLRTTFHFARRRGRWVVVRLGPPSKAK